MKKIILASLLAFGLTSSAIASEDGSGAYVGLGYGVTAYDNDGSTTNNDKLKDDSDAGYKVYAGYQFNKIAAVELSYTDYGTFTYENKGTISPSTISLAANVGYNFLDGQLRPFGLIGFSSLSMDETNPYLEIDEGVSVCYGVGIEYSPKVLQGLGFRAMWSVDAYSVEFINSGNSEDNTELLGMFSAAVQYKF